MDLPKPIWRHIRLQDIGWVLLFTALALFGPHRDLPTILLLSGLGAFQLLEPRLRLISIKGNIASFVVKLALCFLLIGWTDGIISRYYWVLFLPVISAATTLNLIGTIIASLLASGVYLSFLFFLAPDQFVPPSEYPELAMRGLILLVIGFLTQQLAEANRIAAEEAQTAAGQLAEANRHLREAEATVRRSERLAALGQLSAGLAHEIRNPLSTIKTSAEILTQNLLSDNAVAHEMAGFISSEVDRTNSLVTRFLDFARPLAVRLEKTDLAQLIDRAVSDIGKHSPPLGITIYKNYAPDIPPFLLDGQLMERVLYNLLLNAAQASPPQGTVTVKTRQFNGTVEIDVIDRGPGIEPKHLENIFNPFFTTKPSGVGLGLAIVSKIVDEHGGKIRVESGPGEGSVFRVFLPFQEDGR
ncbi:MAG TPA: ATP-binding protein [Bryobacteraceae bacterium]|nr:ATP-binding protein [Bryobacteraceae bacterium]